MPNPARPDLAGTTPAHPGGAPGPNEGGRHDTSHPHKTHRARPAVCDLVVIRRRPGSRPGDPRPCWAGSRIAVLLTGGLVVLLASPAFAAGGGAPTLDGVIGNLRNWIVGILAGVATLFLTIGGLRYLTAGGDPGQVEKAKTALKSAAIGYALAILAPLIVSILASVVGGYDAAARLATAGTGGCSSRSAA